MKKKLFMTLLSVLMVFSFAMPAFAEVSSKNFDLAQNGSSINVFSYLNVDPKGTVEFSINNITNQDWNIKVILTNGNTGNSVERLLTKASPSGKFTNLTGSDSYIIAVKNIDNSSRKGTLNFSWTGTWGGFIN
ncbi:MULTISPECIES: hypothetical protein [unclassified Paenibacillus]|uniref:hypothetical protein n=1 Tax=unclassified Paenibacillus TaxID=185978 RepID=UPI000CFD9BCD|nr:MULTISPECIES: hypothetical protein [unclassified Paenibacillus]PRA08893.1 hypothetical protein CQ043_02635 [Paenibacillus sp. MYb63]PRA48827.1 hypothetical protein CQ061_11090 [Paenibacillus sp. MYb67]